MIESCKQDDLQNIEFWSNISMWNVSWNRYENIVNRFQQAKSFIEHQARFYHASNDRKLRNILSTKTSRQNLSMQKLQNVTKSEIARYNVVANILSKFMYNFTYNATSRKRNINRLTRHFVRIKTYK